MSSYSRGREKNLIHEKRSRYTTRRGRKEVVGDVERERTIDEGGGKGHTGSPWEDDGEERAAGITLAHKGRGALGAIGRN
jgi:hypothetical protein